MKSFFSSLEICKIPTCKRLFETLLFGAISAVAALSPCRSLHLAAHRGGDTGHIGGDQPSWNRRNMEFIESLRLEETIKITWSKHQPITTMATKLCPSVPHPWALPRNIFIISFSVISTNVSSDMTLLQIIKQIHFSFIVPISPLANHIFALRFFFSLKRKKTTTQT